MNPNRHTWMVFVLGLLILLIDAALRGYVLIHGLPTGMDRNWVDASISTFDNGALLVIGYFFGSSLGSARKTELGADSQRPQPGITRQEP